ncbi:acyl carrier protein [Sessilibacter corallicola]|uniref:Carrier domain-containing protein n=1 Tax=Sessilibacter corallicola TaxID=2904075 RepID=A0ABQ0AE78_9GAMM|nr:acyl carrier protein [Sessilibacter corallicola]MCE2028330.1 acyl carrier protein [Sessilibacter corallicola]
MSDEKEVIEKEVRDALKNQLMISHIDFVDLDDELNLESLTQTELRVYLEGQYGLKIDPESMPPAVMMTLESLVNHIVENKTKLAS